MMYLILFIVLCFVGGIIRTLISSKVNQIKKVISIIMISGLIWCPLTLIYVVKHPISSIGYGIKIGIGLQNAKRDLAKILPKDKYNLLALRTLPRVISNLF